MKKIQSLAVLLALTFLINGCNRSEEKVAPTAPAPAATPAPAAAKAELPPGHPPLTTELPPGHPPIDMSQQTLPASTLSDAVNPTWEPPATWQPGRQSSVRRASYSVKGDGDQTADIAVTVFPGAVGGPLANINRWRDQIGMGPVTPLEADEMTTAITVAGNPATVVDFRNKENGQRTVVITVPRGGNSWFYKMTGPITVVEAAKADLIKFVQSTKF